MKNVSKPLTQHPINSAGPVSREWAAFFQSVYAVLDFNQLPVHADNATATAAGLLKGNLYKTATGQVMVVF